MKIGFNFGFSCLVCADCSCLKFEQPLKWVIRGRIVLQNLKISRNVLNTKLIYLHDPHMSLTDDGICTEALVSASLGQIDALKDVGDTNWNPTDC